MIGAELLFNPELCDIPTFPNGRQILLCYLCVWNWMCPECPSCIDQSFCLISINSYDFRSIQATLSLGSFYCYFLVSWVGFNAQHFIKNNSFPCLDARQWIKTLNPALFYLTIFTNVLAAKSWNTWVLGPCRTGSNYPYTELHLPRYHLTCKEMTTCLPNTPTNNTKYIHITGDVDL